MNQSEYRLGFPAIAALIAEQHKGTTPRRTVLRSRLTDAESASRRALDMPPCVAAPPLPSLLDRANELIQGDGDAFAKLKEMRGGCTCFISPPCSACCNPIIEAEAEELLDSLTDPDGWINWYGGEFAPIVGRCEARLRSGNHIFSSTAEELWWGRSGGRRHEIVAYRKVSQ